MKKDRRGNGGLDVGKKAARIAPSRGSVAKTQKVAGPKCPHSHRKTTDKSLLVPKPTERTVYRKAFDLARAGQLTDRTAALLLESHKQGDARATYALATWFIHGVHFEIDASKAFQLLKKASKNGIREATYDLAYAYEIGFGVAKSPTKAFKSYLDAARKGDPDAMEEVVRCVYYGVGFCKCKALAFFLQDLAEESGLRVGR